MTNQDQDVLGRPIDANEKELLRIYEELKALSSRDDLAPCALMNVRQAMVMMWNACNDLDLVFEEPGND
ncbi:MAG: hypothetical protein KDB80_05535 [Planctomycetes bacterium]|nr:hypothetical protein [Planctomycetota bacterium]